MKYLINTMFFITFLFFGINIVYAEKNCDQFDFTIKIQNLHEIIYHGHDHVFKIYML